MDFILELINNVYLCWGVILVLFITNIIMTIKYLNAKKRRKIKEELIEIEKDNNSNDDIDDSNSSELGSIIEKMQKDMEVKPEQVVANFEKEQEENAIISYQELVDCVKNNKIQVFEDDLGEVDYVKELEQEIIEEPVAMPYKNSDSSKTHLDVIDELNNEKKFTSSEVISPVYGRMSDPRYPKMEDYSNENSLKLGENTMDLEPISEEIKKNEDFLKNLVEFRKNL